jgi:hypothetical protein
MALLSAAGGGADVAFGLAALRGMTFGKKERRGKERSEKRSGKGGKETQRQ